MELHSVADLQRAWRNYIKRDGITQRDGITESVTELQTQRDGIT